MKRKLAFVLSVVLLTQTCTTPFTHNFQVQANGSNPLFFKMQEQTVTKEPINMVKGDSMKLVVPKDFKGKIIWTSTNGFYTSGSNKIKRPLKQGETDGGRTYGIADSSHLVSVDETGVVKALQKGNGILITAKDETGKENTWTINVKIYNDKNLIKGSANDFINLRKKFVNSIVGVNNDLSDPAVAKFVQEIDKAAKLWWESYEYKGNEECRSIPWSADLTFKGEKCDINTYLQDAQRFRASYQHVEAMAKAYATTGSIFYKNNDLLKDIISIMDWLSSNCYYPRSQTDNWWTWEIGLAKQVFPICLFIYNDVPKEKLTHYVKAYEIMQPDPFYSGCIGTASTHAEGYREATSANRMDCASGAIGLGLVLEDPEYLMLASEAAASTMKEFQKPILKENGTYEYTDGFYEDGSYIDHSKVPYVASYGVELLSGSINIINLLGQTPWTLKEENLKMLQTYVVKGYIPAVYKGAALDMLRGRAIARPELSDRKAGQNITTLLVKLLDVVDENTAMQIKQNVKYWITNDTISDYVNNITDLGVLNKVKQILNDDTINIKAANSQIHINYPLMDRVIHRMDQYLFGLSMYSSRIQNCEVMNSENLKGWFTGFGMTYLYNEDLNQYTDNYWNTIDPYKLPGTTVVPVEVGNGTPDGTGFYQSGDFLSPEHRVGGTSLGNFGINGMALNGTAMSNGNNSNSSSSIYANNLRGFKSYFMFDSEIVCLGAGISNSNSNGLSTITTVENRKIKEDNSNIVTIDGRKFKDISEEKINTKWMHLAGNTKKGSDIGYYFPEEKEIHIRKTTRTGSFKDIKNDLKAEDYPAVTKNYFEAWFDHGSEPVKESYSYVLLPNMNVAKTKRYAENPNIKMIRNDEKVQAVRNTKHNIIAANFFTKNKVILDGLAVKGISSVMIQEEKGILKISVSDPTMINTDYIYVKIPNKKGIKILKTDKNVKTVLNKNSIEFKINVSGKCGASSYAEIKLAK